MTDLERRTLRVTRADLAASHLPAGRLAGPGRGAVIVVPGYFGSREDFLPILPALSAAGYDVWSYDHLGQGDSAGPPQEEHYTVDLLARDLTEIVDQVRGDAPVHLVGHCLGGFVSRAVTVAGPDRVASLALLACGPALRHRRHELMVTGLDRYLRDGAQTAISRRLERLVRESTGPWFARTRDKIDRASQGFLLGMLRSMYTEPDRTGALRATGVPVSVVYGSLGGRLWSRQDFIEMARRLDAPAVMITDSAHQPAIEQPAATAGTLLRFWADAARARAVGTS